MKDKITILESKTEKMYTTTDRLSRFYYMTDSLLSKFSANEFFNNYRIDVRRTNINNTIRDYLIIKILGVPSKIFNDYVIHDIEFIFKIEVNNDIRLIRFYEVSQNKNEGFIKQHIHSQNLIKKFIDQYKIINEKRFGDASLYTRIQLSKRLVGIQDFINDISYLKYNSIKMPISFNASIDINKSDLSDYITYVKQNISDIMELLNTSTRVNLYLDKFDLETEAQIYFTIMIISKFLLLYFDTSSYPLISNRNEFKQLDYVIFGENISSIVRRSNIFKFDYILYEFDSSTKIISNSVKMIKLYDNGKVLLDIYICEDTISDIILYDNNGKLKNNIKMQSIINKLDDKTIIDYVYDLLAHVDQWYVNNYLKDMYAVNLDINYTAFNRNTYYLSNINYKMLPFIKYNYVAGIINKLEQFIYYMFYFTYDKHYDYKDRIIRVYSQSAIDFNINTCHMYNKKVNLLLIRSLLSNILNESDPDIHTPKSSIQLFILILLAHLNLLEDYADYLEAIN